MATRSSTKCPWRQFYKCIIKYMNSLHAEPCKPQMEIDTFVHAIRHSFPSPTMDLEKHKKSTKQMQTTEQPRRMALDPSSSTNRTSNSDTDSAYSTETESSYTPETVNTKFSSLQDHTKHITRPSTCSQSITILEEEISSTSTRTHPAPPPRCTKGTKPLHIPIPTKSNSKSSHLSTVTHQPKPSTSTRPNTQPTVKQPILPAPKMSTAPTYPQCTRKAPLLPTPTASMRNFNYSNHFKQHITRPSPFYNRFFKQHIPGPSSRYSTFSTLARPATLNNHRYYPQQHIPGPHTANLPYLYQNSFTRPYQQPQGHCTQQVYHVHISLPYPPQYCVA